MDTLAKMSQNIFAYFFVSEHSKHLFLFWYNAKNVFILRAPIADAFAKKNMKKILIMFWNKRVCKNILWNFYKGILSKLGKVSQYYIKKYFSFRTKLFSSFKIIDSRPFFLWKSATMKIPPAEYKEVLYLNIYLCVLLWPMTMAKFLHEIKSFPSGMLV